MKKVSTATATQGRNISQQRLTIGLDLGDRDSWYCVLDEAGQIQLEQRVRTNAKALQEVFGEMPGSRIALEIGTHSPWVSRLLKQLGHEVIVANARKVRLIGESRKKDDRLDPQTLARLARTDPELLYPVKHRRAQAQADLMMIRARAGLVPTEESSGERRRLGHISKQGNALLRFLLVEAAQVTVRSQQEWRNKFFHLGMQCGRKIAKVARKLAVHLYWMWRQGCDYSQFKKFGSHAGEPGHRDGELQSGELHARSLLPPELRLRSG